MKYYTEIVPFELAVKLKDAGYPQFIKNGVYAEDEKYVDAEYLVFPFVSAPTYADVFDWLMDKGWQINLCCYFQEWSSFIANIDAIDVYDMISCGDDEKNWFDSANAAIEKALELLKKV